jgi:hypothetical protein
MAKSDFVEDLRNVLTQALVVIEDIMPQTMHLRDLEAKIRDQLDDLDKASPAPSII